MNIKGFTLSAIALSVVVGLTACGGGSTTTSNGSTSTTTGPITAFGSIFVNGTEFETTNADITVDGKPATEADLKVGMVVSVQNDGGTQAMTVSADEEVEGIVTTGYTMDTATPPVATIVVMGQTVTINDTTIFESKIPDIIADVASIIADNVIEVSGHSDGMGNITATRIEVKSAAYVAGSELEVKGMVTGHDVATNSFKIGGLTIIHDSQMQLPTGFDNGMFVEVKSMENLVNGELIASEISEVSKTGSSDDEYEVEGKIITINIDTDITVNGDTFIIDNMTEFKKVDQASLKEGDLVEVEGYYNADGNLVAKSIELEDGNSMTMPAMTFNETVFSVTTTGVNTGTIILDDAMVDANKTNIIVNNDTIMVDESTMNNVQMFNLESIAMGDYLMIKSMDNGDGTYTATMITRKDMPGAMSGGGAGNGNGGAGNGNGGAGNGNGGAAM